MLTREQEDSLDKDLVAPCPSFGSREQRQCIFCLPHGAGGPCLLTKARLRRPAGPESRTKLVPCRLLVDETSRESLGEPFSGEDTEDHRRDDAQGAGREHGSPFDLEGAKVPRNGCGESAGRSLGQDERVEELIPREDKYESRRSDDAGAGHGQGQLTEDAPF